MAQPVIDAPAAAHSWTNHHPAIASECIHEYCLAELRSPPMCLCCNSHPSALKKPGFTLSGQRLDPRRSASFTERSSFDGSQAERSRGMSLQDKIAGRQQQQQEESSSQKLGDQLKLPPVHNNRGPLIINRASATGCSSNGPVVQDTGPSSDLHLPPIAVGVGRNCSRHPGF